MTEVVRLLLFPAIVVGGWLVSRHHRELARKSARLLSIVVAAIVVCVGVTGWLHSVEAAAATHRWSSHALVIAAWLFVPFAVGVALQRHARERLVTAITQVLALLLLFGVTLLASFTGYLGPSYVDSLVEETMNRFHVLHLFTFPGIAGILVVVWFWFFRPSAARGSVAGGGAGA